VSKIQIPQPLVVGVFDFELEVVAYTGSMSLPSVRVIEMLGESTAITSGQLHPCFFPGRAVVVPEVIDSGGSDPGSHLGEQLYYIVDELVREPEGICG